MRQYMMMNDELGVVVNVYVGAVDCSHMPLDLDDAHDWNCNVFKRKKQKKIKSNKIDNKIHPHSWNTELFRTRLK